MPSLTWQSDTTASGVGVGVPGSIAIRTRPNASARQPRVQASLVEQDRAHAALVFDGDVAIAWAEYGPVVELPNIHHRKQWERDVTRLPDYRTTCLFVDRRYRRQGMAAVAVRGALALIGREEVASSSPTPRPTARQEDLRIIPL